MKHIERILLVNPPGIAHIESDGRKQVKECSPPMGLAYLAASMDEGDFEIKIYDMPAENYYNEVKIDDNTVMWGADYDDFANMLAKFEPDLVGFSCILSNRVPSVLKMAKIVKDTDSDIHTVVGGHHVGAMPESFDDNIDWLIHGEGDHALESLVEIQNVLDIPPLPDGYPEAIPVESIDALPYPRWDLLFMERYWKDVIPMNAVPNKRYIPIMTSRGCPRKCSYCAIPQHCAEGYRKRNIDEVLVEIVRMWRKYDLEEIHFWDDNFTANPAHVRALLSELQTFDLTYRVPTGIDISNVDEEMIDMMAEANFKSLIFGIESGNEYTLDRWCGKEIDLQGIYGKVNRMKAVGLEPVGLFMLGFPYETRNQLQETLDLATSLDLDRIYLSFATPLPGSELYAYCEMKQLLYDDYDPLKVRYNRPYIKNPNIDRDELIALRDNTWKEYMKDRIDLEADSNRGWA